MEERLKALDANELAKLVRDIYKLNNEQVNSLIDLRVLKQDITALLKSLEKRINACIRRSTFIGYRDSLSYADDIATIRSEIESTVLLRDPENAWRLADTVVRHDGDILEPSDDSGGYIGMELQQWCALWLHAASRMDRTQDEWLQAVVEIADGDKYGCRTNFILQAGILLSDETLHRLYARYRRRCEEALARPSDSYGRVPLMDLVHMQQTAEALKSPELYEAAMLLCYPQPNCRQQLENAAVFIKYEDYEGARRRLDAGEWSSGDTYAVETLYQQIFTGIGDHAALRESFAARFENDPSAANLEDLLEASDRGEREALRDHAGAIARQDTDIPRSVELLLFIDKKSEAEARILEHQEAFDGLYYTRLLSLRNMLGKDSTLSTHVVLNRALLDDILNRAYSKAYTHAAAYYRRLVTLDQQIEAYPDTLLSHADYKSRLKERHGRKRSFWRLVEESR